MIHLRIFLDGLDEDPSIQTGPSMGLSISHHIGHFWPACLDSTSSSYYFCIAIAIFFFPSAQVISPSYDAIPEEGAQHSGNDLFRVAVHTFDVLSVPISDSPRRHHRSMDLGSQRVTTWQDYSFIYSSLC